METRRLRRFVAASVLAVLTAAVLLYSCGGGGDEGASATLALYITDDMSTYTQVIATINEIDLLHTGTSDSCTVFTGPLTLDIANLAGILQLIDVASCPAVPYNRIHVEFAKSVELMDMAGTASPCMFTSYKDDRNRVNRLSCGTDTCTLDINGAVNVLAGHQNRLALDFDLKDFDVLNFGDPSACSVTMKVSPLHAGEIRGRHHLEAVTGLVSRLSTTDRTFTLARGRATFSVLYSGITASQQPGIDTLLQRAQDDRLRVKVLASQIDLAGHMITASAIQVKVEGRIAAGSLDSTNHLFTVNYASGRSILIDYSHAIVEGALTEGGWVEVKLYGFDGTSFLARKAEVEAGETSTDD